MTNNEKVYRLAERYGFDECRIISAEPFYRYKEDLDYDNYGDAVTLSYNPKEYWADAKKIIVMIKSYKPFDKKHFSKDHIYVDSYYVTGNECYFNAKKMAKEIDVMGYGVQFSPKISYRHSAIRAGFGFRGMNGLLINEKYGSYFHIQCILTDMPLEVTNNTQKTNICADCGKCVQVCQGNALDGTGRVEMRNCTRHYIPAKRYVPEDVRRRVGNSFIGCMACRAICPHNDKIEYISPPNDLLEACYIPSLIDREHKDYRKHLKLLQDFLGTNEVRPLKLMKSVVIIVGDIKDNKYLEALQKLKNTEKDNDLLEYIDWAVKEIEE